MMKLNLALQGGGAHGAYTWGVLDYLLERRIFDVSYVSGTSAGAINLAVALSHWGNQDETRKALKNFWMDLISKAPPGGSVAGPLIEWTVMFFSPGQFNPLGLNPLRDLLECYVHMDRIKAADTPELLVCATDIKTGKPHYFDKTTISMDALLASACLPRFHHPVMIDGRGYWDGGYSSNPPLVRLIEKSGTKDTLLVRINRHTISHLPSSGEEIRDRVSELTFGKPLDHELEMIKRVKAQGWISCLLEPSQLAIKKSLLHVIDAEEALASLPARSKMIPQARWIEHLFESGHDAAAQWHRNLMARPVGQSNPLTPVLRKLSGRKNDPARLAS